MVAPATATPSAVESAYGGKSNGDRQLRRLYRSADHRLLAGVASGLAEHLGLSAVLLRVVFALLVAAGGAGLLLYAGFWAVVPRRPARPAAPGSSDSPVGGRDPGQLIAVAALTLGAVLLVGMFGGGIANIGFWPVVVGGIGVALLWRQADVAQRERWLGAPGRLDWRALPAAAGNGRGAWARTGAGLALVIAGMAGFLAANNELRQARDGLLAITVVVTGLALVSGPWWVRLVGDLRAERRARIREQERAELAAHVHDSVLQTLALIQRSAQDPREVAKLARRQERELRAWLYRPAVADGAGIDRRADLGDQAAGSGRVSNAGAADGAAAAGLRGALEAVAADVEEQYGVPIEVVLVGDCPLDERLSSAVQAAREAMVNAAKHAGAGEIAVYAEVEPDLVTVYVRDRGCGFDAAAVAVDRAGIRESVIGRMERHGGAARIASAAGAGTEVELSLPLSPAGRAR